MDGLWRWLKREKKTEPQIGLQPYEGPWVKMPDGTVAKKAITLPVFPTTDNQWDPLATFEENQRNQEMREQFQKYAEENLAQAFFICSQSQTARQALQRAKKAGFFIAMDYHTELGNFTDDGGIERVKMTNAVTNTEERVIGISPHLAVYEMVQALDHELRHASFAPAGLREVFKEPAFPRIGLRHHPLAILQRILSDEADAPAFEVQCAYERMVGDQEMGLSGAPKNQFLFPEGWAYLSVMRPRQVTAYINTLPLDGHKNGLGLARVHESMYAENDWRSAYEQSLHQLYQQMPPKAIKDPAFLTQTIPADEPQSLYHWMGIPYLATHAPQTNYQDAHHLSVNGATGNLLKELERIRYENPSEEFLRNDQGTPWNIKIRPTPATPPKSPRHGTDLLR